jgi:hypothetical protein
VHSTSFSPDSEFKAIAVLLLLLLLLLALGIAAFIAGVVAVVVHQLRKRVSARRWRRRAPRPSR